jgi:hypothetical protein
MILFPTLNRLKTRYSRHALCTILCTGLFFSFFRAACLAGTDTPVPANPPAIAGSGPGFTDAEKEAQRKAATDLLSALESKIASGEKSIVIPPGDYRFDQRKGVRFHRIEDVEIDATGATFWFGPGNGVLFEECRNSKLLGLTIDSDPLPWTQGVIEEIDPKAETIVVRIEPGYTVLEGDQLVKPCRISFFDGQTRLKLPVVDDQATSFESLGERRLKITKFASYRVFRNPVPGRPVKPGDLVALFVMYGGGANIALKDCEGMRLENITNHGASAFAYVETHGPGGNQYVGCKLTRRPGTNRLMASRADCFHSYMVEKGPLVENCEFSHSGDDLMNIHGFFGLVLDVKSPKEFLLAAPFGAILRAGSQLQISDPEAKADPREARVRSVEEISDPDILAEAKSLPQTLAEQRKLRIRELSQASVTRVLLEEGVSLEKYDVVSCPDYSGRGAVVRNNHFHNGHIRGILLKSHDVLVEGNRIERTGHGGIVVEPEFYWLEGAFCRNIRIRNNTLVENGWSSFDVAGFGLSHAAIQVGCTFGKRMFPRTLVSGILNQDIQITGNKIERPAGYAIMVMNTRQAVIADNVITGAFTAGPMPAFFDFSGLPDDATALTAEERDKLKRPQDAIFVYRSEDVTLAGNSVEEAP